MTENQISKHKFDLEDRTYKFALNTRDLVRKVHQTISNNEYSKQLIRSSGSVSANYIEANESLSKKDFIMRIKISRKECKESRLWLNLLELPDSNLSQTKEKLIQESYELIKIFTAIIVKSV